jgi:signal transduction histidine kinase
MLSALLGLSLTLIVAALLWTQGLLGRPRAVLFDVHDPVVWLRFFVLFCFLATPMGFAFVSMVEHLEEAARKLRETLRREREERTAQLVLRTALERSQRITAMGQLAAGLAHDIGNGLMVLTAAAELLEREPSASPRVKALASQMLEGVHTVSETLQQMRSLGHSAPASTTVRPEAAVGWLARMLASSLPRSIRVSTEVEGTCAVQVDGTRLQQALLNLAFNARDAMPRGGELVVTSHECERAHVPPDFPARPGLFVVLCVSDTGLGMDPATVQRVFEPLFTTKGSRGTGLGLAMVHAFVEDAQGFIEVESEPNHGTTFRLFLPADQAAIQPAERRASA